MPQSRQMTSHGLSIDVLSAHACKPSNQGMPSTDYADEPEILAREEAETSRHGADLSDNKSAALSEPFEHQMEEEGESLREAEYTEQLNVTANDSEGSNTLAEGVGSTASQTPDAAVSMPGDMARDETDDTLHSKSSEVSSFQVWTIAEQWVLR